MKYVRIYWTLFAPLMKKSIAKRFDRDLAQQALHRGKAEYRRLLSSADDLGPGNPMAMNAYFAYVFAGAWLGSGKKITPDEMALVMTDVLESRLLRTVFGMTNLNRTPKKWYRDMKKYDAWFKKQAAIIRSTGTYILMSSCIRMEASIISPAARSASSVSGMASQS